MLRSPLFTNSIVLLIEQIVTENHNVHNTKLMNILAGHPVDVVTAIGMLDHNHMAFAAVGYAGGHNH